LTIASIFNAIFVVLYLLAPALAERLKKPFEGIAVQAIYAAPILLFVFPALARIEPAAASPWMLFGTMYVLLALIAWRALAIPASPLFFVAAFFALAAEASWSATHLLTERLGTACCCTRSSASSISACRSLRDAADDRSSRKWGGGAVVLGSLVMLLFLAAGPRAAAGLWGMAFLPRAAQRGSLHRKRRRPSARVVGGGQPVVVAGPWCLVG
jgi:hypothetical protein